MRLHPHLAPRAVILAGLALVGCSGSSPEQSGGDGGIEPRSDASRGKPGHDAAPEAARGHHDASGGNAPPDASPPEVVPDAAKYSLIVDTPTNGATVKGTAVVNGYAPGFLNVEVWDSAHHSPPLARVKPAADGTFSTTVDTTALADGPDAWTVWAWDSPPGMPSTHSASQPLTVTISNHVASSGGDASVDTGAPTGNWILTWSDEFSGANGSAPDPTYWTYTSLGGGTSGPGWGVENDTPSAVAIQNGNLVITSTEDGNGTVSSGAIDTKGKFQQTYGRFEARIKVAEGAGTWSAFWMMGDTNGKGWPTCGEIDVLEVVASSPATAYGTTHTGNASNASQDTPTGGTWMLPSGDLGDDYHVYAVEWAPDSIKWYVDDNLYETQTNTTLTSGALWAFDHPFYVIVNLEMGGSWAGPPNASTFPATMLVDYVRVYKAG